MGSEPMFCAMFHLVMGIKKSGNKLAVPSVLPECLTVEVLAKLGSSMPKKVMQKKTITKKKIVKVPNPNKKKKKTKKKANLKKNDDTIQIKQSMDKPIVDDNATMDFGNDNW